MRGRAIFIAEGSLGGWVEQAENPSGKTREPGASLLPGPWPMPVRLDVGVSVGPGVACGHEGARADRDSARGVPAELGHAAVRRWELKGRASPPEDSGDLPQ